MQANAQKKRYVGYYLLGILILKIMFLCCFSSDYQDAMFFPFVNQFLKGMERGNYNPYEYYYQHGMLSSFPYPPVMLGVESIAALVVRLLNLNHIFLTRFVFKLPTLLADCCCAWILSRMYKGKIKYIALLYFTSPIVLYACYMHGQLDIIPMTFLMACIWILLKQNKGFQWKAGLMLALAVLTKQHTLAVVPILFLFMEKRHGFKKSMQTMVCFIVVVFAGIIPFWSEGFIRQVICNREQKQIMGVYLDYGSIHLVFPILMVLLLYLKAFYLNKLNQDLLMSFCGILFAVFLAFVPPMPGWYVWIVPFITIFFIQVGKNKYKNSLLYLMLNGSYLIYFLFFHQTGISDLYLLRIDMNVWKCESQTGKNIIFTIMTGCLLYIIYQMYQLGIASNSLYIRGNIPFSIGISGDSGSGKSCMLKLVKGILGNKNVLEIEGDGDHKWERGESNWSNYTHLDPKANYLYRQAMDIQMLKAGKSVYRVEYEHDTGKFSKPHKNIPKRYIVVCGLHSLYLPQMRKQLDLKIFMDTDEKLRRYWKVQRDIQNRGYDVIKIQKQIEERKADFERYICPQKKYADLIIKYVDFELQDYFQSDYKPCISMEITVSSGIDLDSFVEEMQRNKVKVKHDYSDDLNRQTILVNGKDLEKVEVDFNHLASMMIPQMEEITSKRLSSECQKGIRELFLLLVISEKMRGNI